MPEIQERNSNLPKSNIYEIYTAAYNAQTLVKITGCIQHDDKLTDITCYGRIKSIDGREALVVITEQEVLSRPGKIYPNEFEYSRFQVQSATPSPWVLASSKKTS